MDERTVTAWDDFSAVHAGFGRWDVVVHTRALLAVLVRAEAEALKGRRRSAVCDGREIAKAVGFGWGAVVMACRARSDLIEALCDFRFRLTAEGRAVAGAIDQDGRDRRAAAVREAEARQRAMAGRDATAAERKAFKPSEPEPERLAKGDLKPIEERDPDLNRVRHLKARGTLETMLKRETISFREYTAGLRIMQLVEEAAIPDIKACDLERPIVDSSRAGGHDQGVVVFDAARQALWSIFKVFGGHSSPAGSLVWHVLVLNRPVSEWAGSRGWSRGSRGNPQMFSGMLVASLAVIAERLDDTNNWGNLMPARKPGEQIVNESA